jgi:hypothetical protein
MESTQKKPVLSQIAKFMSLRTAKELLAERTAAA